MAGENQNAQKKPDAQPEAEKPKLPPWVVWIILAPVYLGILILLFFWINKMSTPKIELTPDQEGAFIAPVRIRQISPEDQKKSKEVEERVKKALEQDPRQKMTERRKKRQAERNFRIIGSTPGKLLETVEYAHKNPPAIKAVFDNDIVINSFLKRETVEPLLSDFDKLKEFLISSPKVGEFLNNPTVTKAINNPNVLKAVSESRLMSKILTSASVEKLINSPKDRQEIIDKNTRLGLLTANFNLLQELKVNPHTSHIAGEYIKD
jgi:hypothetical protein